MRVILTSGYNEENVMERFTDDKPNGFIQKTFQLLDLKDMIEQVMK